MRVFGTSISAFLRCGGNRWSPYNKLLLKSVFGLQRYNDESSLNSPTCQYVNHSGYCLRTNTGCCCIITTCGAQKNRPSVEGRSTLKCIKQIPRIEQSDSTECGVVPAMRTLLRSTGSRSLLNDAVQTPRSKSSLPEYPECWTLLDQQSGRHLKPWSCSSPKR